MRVASSGHIRFDVPDGISISDDNIAPTAGDLASGASFGIPKLHIRGNNSQSGAYELMARFQSGTDANDSGATIVLNHSNDRGLALQGGRGQSNRSFGAIKAVDNLGRLSDCIDFLGGNGAGVNYLRFFTGESTTTNEALRITSNGNVLVNQTVEFGSAVKLSVRGASSAISDGAQIFDVTTTAAASGGTRLAFGVNEDNYTWIRSYESGTGSRDLVFSGVAEYGRFDSSGRLLLGSNFSSNVNTFKYSIKESGTVNAAILFLDTDNMRGGICGATRGNNELITGTTNMDFVVGSLYADTHIIRGVSGNQNGAIGMTIEGATGHIGINNTNCLLYTSPSPRDVEESRMPGSG